MEILGAANRDELFLHAFYDRVGEDSGMHRAGEVEKPRGKTLALLAKRLEVPADEIASY